MLDHWFSSTPFKSRGALAKMSQRSPISARAALARALEYQLKTEGGRVSSSFYQCLSFKQGEYADYYFFRTGFLRKSDVISRQCTLVGIFVHAQTGDIRVINEREQRGLNVKLDFSDYERIYGGESRVIRYKSYSLNEEEDYGQARQARQLLLRYASQHYPKIVKAARRYQAFELSEGRYFFRLSIWGNNREVGFVVDVLARTVGLVIEPLHELKRAGQDDD